MFINTYDYLSLNDEPDDDGDDAAAAAEAAAAEAAKGDEPKPSPFRQGVEATGRVEQTPDDEPPVELDADGNPIAKAPETPPADTPPDDEAAAAAAKKKADDEFKAGVDKEIADLKASGVKLSQRGEDRFREMSSTIREQSERLAAFDAVEKELPTLRASAAAAEKWEDALESTGTDQEQFGRLLGYAYAINKGTREQKVEAHAALKAELAWLEKEIGVKGDHYNPLDEHADLKARVESGDLDEADALDLIEARRVKAGQEKETADQKATRERNDAIAAGSAQVKAFEDEQKKKDPQYQVKLRMLKPTIELIASTLPPEKWLPAIKKSYDAINIPAVKDTVRPPVSRQPVRPGPSHQNTEAPNVANAFRFGVNKAKQGGR